MRRFVLWTFAIAMLGGSLCAQAQGQGSQTPSSGTPVNSARKGPEGKHGKHHHHRKHHHKKS